MIATQILATVETGRLQKAVEGFVKGSYTIMIASQTDEEIRGFVTNGDGKHYGVVLSEGLAFCSCPDAMYRKSVCKHAVVLALYTIRNPQAMKQAKGEEKPYNLSLGKTRQGFAFAA